MAQEEDGVPKGHCGQEAFDEPETTAESKSGRYHILMPSETGQKGSNTTLYCFYREEGSSYLNKA